MASRVGRKTKKLTTLRFFYRLYAWLLAELLKVRDRKVGDILVTVWDRRKGFVVDHWSGQERWFAAEELRQIDEGMDAAARLSSIRAKLPMSAVGAAQEGAGRKMREDVIGKVVREETRAIISGAWGALWYMGFGYPNRTDPATVSLRSFLYRCADKKLEQPVSVGRGEYAIALRAAAELCAGEMASLCCQCRVAVPWGTGKARVPKERARVLEVLAELRERDHDTHDGARDGQCLVEGILRDAGLLLLDEHTSTEPVPAPERIVAHPQAPEQQEGDWTWPAMSKTAIARLLSIPMKTLNSLGAMHGMIPLSRQKFRLRYDTMDLKLRQMISKAFQPGQAAPRGTPPKA